MSLPAARAIYRFGEFECDASSYELKRNGRRVRLSGQPMDLLLLLLERPRELVAREEIAQRLWAANVFVDLDAGIRTAILKVRQALGDSRDAPRFVETVPGRGYRFIAALQVVPGGPQVRRIVQQEAATQAARRHNLPADVTSFVGRTRALRELRALIQTSRLLTLTGAGGVGKTRLALRLASTVDDAFPDGVWAVDLAPLATDDLIAQAVAGAFGVRESPQRPLLEAVLDYARDRSLLLLLDTCEHRVEGCAVFIETLLRAAPAVRVVATSREAIGAPGETVYRVPSLSVPESSTSCPPDALFAFDGTELFIQRAASAQPDFTVHPETAGAIASICRRLDGIPLAIELVAAQVASLSPQQIEARLAYGFLTGGMRTSVARHKTVNATVEWSYRLLSEPESLLFRRLSVFPGSWSLDATEYVCSGDGLEPAQTLELVSRLVAKSLVLVAGQTERNRRYRLLGAVRQYSFNRLTEAGGPGALHDRHFTFYYREFRAGLRTLTGPDQAHWLRRLHTEQENLRAALEWGLSSPALREQGVELTGALFWYWTKRGLFTEGRHWLQRAAAVPAARRLRAVVSLGLGHMDYFQGRFDSQVAHGDELLGWAREEGDPWLVAMALFGRGLASFECGRVEEAVHFATAAREAAAPADISGPLLIFGNVALVEGDNDRALRLFEEGIRGLRRDGELWGLGILLCLAAGLRTIQGDFDQARAHGAEAMSIYCDLEDPRGIAWSLDVFAGLHAAEGRADAAARVWGASDGLLASVGGTLVPTIGWIRDRYFASAAQAMGEREFEQARREGRTMLPERAMGLASGSQRPIA
jgi:non-specific serine/threonine protein kinase